jgi:predicted AAA+ superfamily ATPase
MQIGMAARVRNTAWKGRMVEDNETQRRIAEALERLAPPAQAGADLEAADAFVWRADNDTLEPVAAVNRVASFAEGLPANNALLWGARGSGKSSLVKAVHAEVNRKAAEKIVLVEIHREDIGSLPRLLTLLRKARRYCILFCDDLSFDDSGDTSYKSLKAVLEGGIEGRPANVMFYATSNRRHLMPRDMIENERSTAINPSEATEEKVSLSDRFGLWLGFHNCDQDTFFAMIAGYVDHYGLKATEEEWRAAAVEWSVTRGARSGRVAWQFIQDLAGRLGQHLVEKD